MATLAFVLMGNFWWLYYHHSMQLVEDHIAHAGSQFQTVHYALVGTHAVLLTSVIGCAASLHHLVASLFEAEHHDATSARLLCASVGLCFGTFVWLRARAAYRLYTSRLVGAGFVSATGVVAGPHLSGFVLLGLVVLVCLAVNVWEAAASSAQVFRQRHRSAQHSDAPVAEDGWSERFDGGPCCSDASALAVTACCTTESIRQ